MAEDRVVANVARLDRRQDLWPRRGVQPLVRLELVRLDADQLPIPSHACTCRWHDIAPDRSGRKRICRNALWLQGNAVAGSGRWQVSSAANNHRINEVFV